MKQSENISNDSGIWILVSNTIASGLLGAILVAAIFAIFGALIGLVRGFDLFNLVSLGDRIVESALGGAILGAKLGAIGGAVIGAVKGLLEVDAHKAAIEAERKFEKERKAEAERIEKERKAEAEHNEKIETEHIALIPDLIHKTIGFACVAAIVNARISESDDVSAAERTAAKAIENTLFEGDDDARQHLSEAAIEATRIAAIERTAKTSIDFAVQATRLCTKINATRRSKVIAETRITTICAAICETRDTGERKGLAKAINDIESARSQAIEDARRLAEVRKSARIVTDVEGSDIQQTTEQARRVATKAIIDKSLDHRKDFQHIVAIEAMLSIAILDMIEASWPAWAQSSIVEEQLPEFIRKARNFRAIESSRSILNVPIHNYKQLPKLESPAGYVYVIKDVSRTHNYKIGRTNHPGTRMNNFGVKLPFETEVIAILKTDDAETLEQRLHQKFVEQHNRGEWFDLSDSQVKQIQSM